MWVAKIIAFGYGPVLRDVLHAVAAPLVPDRALADLTGHFLVAEHAGTVDMHGVIRDYISARTTDAEQVALAHRLTRYHRERARTVFLEGLGQDEPSYGMMSSRR